MAVLVKVGVSVSSSRGWISNGIVPCRVPDREVGFYQKFWFRSFLFLSLSLPLTFLPSEISS